jgi:sporulation protein YlmC with PRC-barrel domain
MRTFLLAAASVLALTVGAAQAQQNQGTGTNQATPPVTDATGQPVANLPPAPNPLDSPDVSKLNGADVYGADGKRIGDVSTALMQPSTKTIDRLVVSSGGVLGIGMHYVVLPIADFSWDAQRGAFRISETAKDVKAMPEWTSE